MLPHVPSGASTQDIPNTPGPVSEVTAEADVDEVDRYEDVVLLTDTVALLVTEGEVVLMVADDVAADAKVDVLVVPIAVVRVVETCIDKPDADDPMQFAPTELQLDTFTAPTINTLPVPSTAIPRANSS